MGSVMWYRWPTLTAFNVWHDAICSDLHIPHPGRNAATGEIDPDAQWTTAYTTVTEVADDDWRAWSDDDVAALHPELLGTPSEPPPSPDNGDAG
jgi:hypothetical protein